LVAAADEILMTRAVYESAEAELLDRRPRDFRLKGLDSPIKLWAA
jgi:hypothetical protein